MKKLFTLLVIISLFTNANAQFPYYLYVLDETYTPLTNPIALTTETWDDPVINVPIGFDFSFLNTTTNNLWISGLGAMMSINPIENEPFDILMVYQSDIIDIGYSEGTMMSPISYKISGEPGNRICKIEWKNVGFYNEVEEFGTSLNTVSFQCWLFEGSNDIDVRFGPNSIKQDDIAHDGIGPWIGLIDGFMQVSQTFNHLYALQGSPDAPTVIDWTDFPMNMEEFVFLNEDPTNGTVYRFTSEPMSIAEPEVLIPNQFQLYPLPASDIINLKFSSRTNTLNEISIYNLTGDIVKTLSSNLSEIRMDVSNLSQGVYIVRVSNELGDYSKKLIKD